MKWIGLGALVMLALGILWDAWRYRQNSRRVLELLRQRGPMTGLEISQAGVSRAHTYLVLNRLVADGKVERFPAPNPRYGGQHKYKVTREPRS